MRCIFCKADMVHVDDSGSFTSVDNSWDYYICPWCKADVSIVRKYNNSKLIYEWDKNPHITNERYLTRLENEIVKFKKLLDLEEDT